MEHHRLSSYFWLSHGAREALEKGPWRPGFHPFSLLPTGGVTLGSHSFMLSGQNEELRRDQGFQGGFRTKTI